MLDYVGTLFSLFMRFIKLKLRVINVSMFISKRLQYLFAFYDSDIALK